MRAWLNLRHNLPERIDCFTRGLRRAGYSVEIGVTMNPGPNDLLCSWNRINVGEAAALAFEARGCKVLVAENAAWGNDFAGKRWWSLARNRHNTAGRFDYHGPERWDSLEVEPEAWRASGETVILPQRGIGASPTAMPHGWPEKAKAKYGGRIRRHPGTRPSLALGCDLAQCGHVVTWGSGAAVKALMWGIPVTAEMPDWIGHQDNTDGGRLAMLRHLAWAQWTPSEIQSGEAFSRLLAA